MAGEFFAVFGVPAAIGRVLDVSDPSGSGGPVVLSHRLWQRRFKGDTGVVGRRLRLGEAVREVVGVMPSSFRYPEDAEYWAPYTIDVSDLASFGRGPFTGIARLESDDLTAASAQAAVLGPPTAGGTERGTKVVIGAAPRVDGGPLPIEPHGAVWRGHDGAAHLVLQRGEPSARAGHGTRTGTGDSRSDWCDAVATAAATGRRIGDPRERRRVDRSVARPVDRERFTRARDAGHSPARRGDARLAGARFRGRRGRRQRVRVRHRSSVAAHSPRGPGARRRENRGRTAKPGGGPRADRAADCSHARSSRRQRADADESVSIAQSRLGIRHEATDRHGDSSVAGDAETARRNRTPRAHRRPVARLQGARIRRRHVACSAGAGACRVRERHDGRRPGPGRTRRSSNARSVARGLSDAWGGSGERP